MVRFPFRKTLSRAGTRFTHFVRGHRNHRPATGLEPENLHSSTSDITPEPVIHDALSTDEETPSATIAGDTHDTAALPITHEEAPPATDASVCHDTSADGASSPDDDSLHLVSSLSSLDSQHSVVSLSGNFRRKISELNRCKADFVGQKDQLYEGVKKKVKWTAAQKLEYLEYKRLGEMVTGHRKDARSPPIGRTPREDVRAHFRWGKSAFKTAEARLNFVVRYPFAYKAKEKGAKRGFKRWLKVFKKVFKRNSKKRINRLAKGAEDHLKQADSYLQSATKAVGFAEAIYRKSQARGQPRGANPSQRRVADHHAASSSSTTISQQSSHSSGSSGDYGFDIFEADDYVYDGVFEPDE